MYFLLEVTLRVQRKFRVLTNIKIGERIKVDLKMLRLQNKYLKHTVILHRKSVMKNTNTIRHAAVTVFENNIGLITQTVKMRFIRR